MTGNGEKDYCHEYIKFKPKGGDSKTHKVLETMYPNMKQDELELLAMMTTKADIKEYAKNLGMDDNAIKKLV